MHSSRTTRWLAAMLAIACSATIAVIGGLLAPPAGAAVPPPTPVYPDKDTSPWAAKLYITYVDDWEQETVAQCSGVLIDRNIVMSAAHCFSFTQYGHVMSVTVDVGLGAKAQSSYANSAGITVSPTWNNKVGAATDYAYVRLMKGFTYSDVVMPANLISADLAKALYPNGVPAGTPVEVDGYPGGSSAQYEQKTTVIPDCASKIIVFCGQLATMGSGWSGGGVIVRTDKYGPLLIGIYSNSADGTKEEFADLTTVYSRYPLFNSMQLNGVYLYSGLNMGGQAIRISDCSASAKIDLMTAKFPDGSRVNDNTQSIAIFGACSVTLTTDKNGGGKSNEYRLSDGSLDEIGNKTASTAIVNYLGAAEDGVFLYPTADFQGRAMPLGPANRDFETWISGKASSIWNRRQHASHTLYASDAVDWTGVTQKSWESQANLALPAVLPGQLTGWDNRIRSTRVQ